MAVAAVQRSEPWYGLGRWILCESRVSEVASEASLPAASSSHERRRCHMKELTTLGSWLRSGVAAGPGLYGEGYSSFAIGL